MLPRKNRISRKDFPSHSVKGFRAFSPLFSGVFYPKKDGFSRASVVVSKKTAKTAVVRNALRRRFYDLVAPYIKDSVSPFVLVVYPKAEAKAAEIGVLKAEIEKAFKQAKLIK